MSYQTTITSLISVLKIIPEFNFNNVSNADYRVLNSGAAQAVILFPGGFNSEASTLGNLGDIWLDWDIRIELYIRYTSDPDAANKIAQLRQLIIEKVAEYPRLNGSEGLFYASIRRGETPVPVFKQDGSGPFFWLQTMICTAREDLSSVQVQE